MSMKFVNFSNLHTNKWPQDRMDAVYELIDDGEIVNVPFPILPADAKDEEVVATVKRAVDKVLDLNPDIVFCQGEFAMCFKAVTLLKAKGIKVITVCNERIISKEDGKTISGFKFVQFREY